MCGALRWEATGEPLYSGHCYCEDCRKASGSGFIPFIGISRKDVTFSGAITSFRSTSWRGGDAVRNFCPVCGGLVFGGEVGKSDDFTIYAGSLDDPASFKPTIAIFTRNRPAWALVPPELTQFDELPPQR